MKSVSIVYRNAIPNLPKKTSEGREQPKGGTSEKVGEKSGKKIKTQLDGMPCGETWKSLLRRCEPSKHSYHVTSI